MFLTVRPWESCRDYIWGASWITTVENKSDTVVSLATFYWAKGANRSFVSLLNFEVVLKIKHFLQAHGKSFQGV